MLHCERISSTRRKVSPTIAIVLALTHCETPWRLPSFRRPRQPQSLLLPQLLLLAMSEDLRRLACKPPRPNRPP